MKKQTPEQTATAVCLSAASVRGSRLLRNNSGGFYDENGRFINFGLGNEGSRATKTMAMGDYVGITPVTITPEMVGKQLGVFTMLEIKPDGKVPETLRKATKHPTSREGKQLNAINFVRENKGIAWFVSNADEVDQVIDFHISEFQK